MKDILESSLSMDKAAIPEEMYTVAVDCIVSLDEADRRMAQDPRVRATKRSERVRN